MPYKHYYKNETPRQAVCNKMPLDPIPDEGLKRLEKVLID